MFWLLFFALLFMAFTPLARRLEQRATIKFLQKTGKKPMEIWRALRGMYGQETLSKTQVREWFGHFQVGDILTSTKDNPRPGRPRRRLQYAARVCALLAQDHRLTLDEMSLVFHVPASTGSSRCQK